VNAREQLVALLASPPPRATEGPWLDAVEGRPGSRGRLQDLWQSGGGALGYDGVLAVGDRLEGVVPDAVGGRYLHDFYGVDERLHLRRGQTVLDLACGPGTLTRRLAHAVGRGGLVIASDLSVPMLYRAARSVPDAQVAFLRADAMDLPLRDDTVDAVCCSLCLHLVPDLETALTQIARVLRPGGRVAISVPGHAPGPFRLVTEGLSRFGEARLFSRGELPEALARHGLVGASERWAPGLLLVDAQAPTD
jgi:arsenite methyltransferase